jgi:hypothetical protein
MGAFTAAARRQERTVSADEPKFTGFVFKIQANMDPKHRDRIAFMRICSGKFEKGMKLLQGRTGKEMRIGDALTFLLRRPGKYRRSLCRRHYRPAQPRHHPDRRHFQRRRKAALHRHPVLRPGTVPPRGAA